MSDTQLMQRFFSNYMSSLDRNHVVTTAPPVVQQAVVDVLPKPEKLLIPEEKQPWCTGLASAVGPTVREHELPNLFTHPTYNLHWSPSKREPSNGWVVRDKNNSKCGAMFFSIKANEFVQEHFDQLTKAEISFIEEALVKANNIQLV